MLCDADQLTALIDDLDLAARAPLGGIDLGDGVGEGDGVADVNGTQEADLVVAERHSGLVAGRAMAFLDHHGGAGGGEADQQRTVGDALAVLGARHVLLVDMVDGEVASDAGEQVDVGLADGLGKGDAVAGLDVEVAHGVLLLIVCPPGRRGPSVSAFLALRPA